MSASVVGICNRALQKIGANAIQALSDNTREARACNAAYEPVRDRLLQEHRWRFAILRTELAAEGTAPAWGRAGSFQLPSDYLAMVPRYPEDNELEIDYEIESGKILSDQEGPLYIRYISKVTDPNKMTPLFREYLSAMLAFELCEQITQSNAKKESCRADIDLIMKTAKKANAFEMRPQTPPDSSWVNENYR